MHTDSPDLTPCFQNSLLAWAPCFYLWAALPGYLLYREYHCGGYIVLSRLSRLKTVRGPGISGRGGGWHLEGSPFQGSPLRPAKQPSVCPRDTCPASCSGPWQPASWVCSLSSLRLSLFSEVQEKFSGNVLPTLGKLLPSLASGAGPRAGLAVSE